MLLLAVTRVKVLMQAAPLTIIISGGNCPTMTLEHPVSVVSVGLCTIKLSYPPLSSARTSSWRCTSSRLSG